MILIDSSILDTFYCKNLLIYNIIYSRNVPTTAGNVQGVVVLVTGERSEVWDIEFVKLHGPNMVSCKIVSRSQ